MSRGYHAYQKGLAVSVLKVVLVLVAIWIAIGIVGFVIKGLFWLFVIACVLFGFTLAGSRISRSPTRR
ncbi:MAG: hypothetical protein JWO57_2530 [Pseudonocardiales bacterium]|nr:hypothetical protein [Pseudonocardiales bacterium]